MTWQFSDRTEHDPGWGVPFPTEWLAGWMRETHAHGRRRLGAVAAFHAQLQSFGVTGSALVSGAWMADDDARQGVWRRGPWTLPGGSESDRLWADGAGDMSEDWLRAVIADFLADPDRRAPGPTPRLYRVHGGEPPGLMLDVTAAGRRTGFVVVCLSEAVLPAVEALLEAPVIRWAVPVISGLLRSEQFRVHWDALSEVMVGPQRTDWEGGQERPVNAQEVVHRVGQVATAYAREAASAFETAVTAIFAPDPDDEYVHCLGAHGTEPYVYDASLSPHKPRVEGVEFGLTPSYAVGAAWEPTGGPVVVRDLPDRAAMTARYRDLGFEKESLQAGATHPAPMLAEQYVHDGMRAAALRGPWVFTAQRLPRFLSPSGRNMLVRFQGRTTSPIWSGEEEQQRTSRDRRIRLASLGQRIHDDLCGLFAQGLSLWQDGLRDEVLRELAGQRSWPSVCQTLSSWLSARAVSVFHLVEGRLCLLAWSLPRQTPLLRFDPDEALMDSQEMRLLQAPLYPRRDEISPEGFGGWPALEEELGFVAENVGCVPVIASGRPVGLLRVDGAMSLYGGLVRRSSPQGGLHHHRPTQTPAHIRPVLDEMARLLALTLDFQPARAGEWSDWSTWVERARRGHVPPEEVAQRLDALRARARTRVLAAQLVGVHRNTLRRQLRILAAVLDDDDDVVW